MQEKAGTRGLQPVPGSRGWTQHTTQVDPGCRRVTVAALCQGHPDLPGSHQKSHRWSLSFPHHLQEPGQERCVRERWIQGWAGAWAGSQAPSPAVQGSLPSSPPAVLEPKATEGSTSPLLTQQLFQPQENPSLSSPQPTPAVFCADQASRSSGAALIRPRYPPAAHTTAVNAFPPGNYFGHGSVGHMPHLNALGESGITHEHLIQETQRSALGRSAQ